MTATDWESLLSGETAQESGERIEAERRRALEEIAGSDSMPVLSAKKLPGRPVGAKNKAKPPKARPQGQPPKEKPTAEKTAAELVAGVLKRSPTYYKCTKCGKTALEASGQFYAVPNMHMLDANQHYGTLCIECTKICFADWGRQFQNDKLALTMLCATYGFYFSEPLYEKLATRAEGFTLSAYVRALNGVQYRDKNFNSFLSELHTANRLFGDTLSIEKTLESEWRPEDARNKTYTIQTVGYDCFADESYGANDRKYLFNLLAGYLTEDVSEDPHKMNSVIQMVKMQLQVEQITRIMNRLLRTTIEDYGNFQKLSSTKDSLQKTINQMARENGISAIATGKSGRRNHTLTGIMRDMAENGFDDAKVNYLDIKMTGAYQHLARISARGLMDELRFTNDDFARMLAEQSEIVSKQARDLCEMEEKNRLLYVENDKMRAQIADLAQELKQLKTIRGDVVILEEVEYSMDGGEADGNTVAKDGEGAVPAEA